MPGRRKIKAPVYVVHGTRDDEVPIEHGKMIVANAQQAHEPFWVAGAGHNDLLEVAGDAFFVRLKAFLLAVGKKGTTLAVARATTAYCWIDGAAGAQRGGGGCRHGRVGAARPRAPGGGASDGVRREAGEPRGRRRWLLTVRHGLHAIEPTPSPSRRPTVRSAA